MAEFLCCPPENTTTLLIRYTSIQNKKVWSSKKKSLFYSQGYKTHTSTPPPPPCPRYVSTATVNGSCNNGNLRSLPPFNSTVSNSNFRNTTSLDRKRRQCSYVGDTSGPSTSSDGLGRWSNKGLTLGRGRWPRKVSRSPRWSLSLPLPGHIPLEIGVRLERRQWSPGHTETPSRTTTPGPAEHPTIWQPRSKERRGRRPRAIRKCLRVLPKTPPEVLTHHPGVLESFRGWEVVCASPPWSCSRAHLSSCVLVFPPWYCCRMGLWKRSQRLGLNSENTAFSSGALVKNPPANAEDAGSIPGQEDFPGEGNGNLLQCSCLGNPMDRGAWWTTVHGVAKSQLWLSTLRPVHTCTHTHTHRI